MRYDNKNHKIYNPRRDSGSCLDILILLAIVLIILPFAGTYKCHASNYSSHLRQEPVKKFL